MQFKYPEILYALFLLIIPIIIHLFQLQRFKKVAFTNVNFLKNIELQTRKSSQLKKWLILATRLLLFSSLIIAFSQPFFSNLKTNTKHKSIIYLDNSLSMQAKGSNGELLKDAAEKIIENSNLLKDKITLLTNDNIYKDIEINELKNILLNLNYYPISLDLETILFKINHEIDIENNNLNNVLLITDFQNNTFSKINNFTNVNSTISLIKETPVANENIFIDSVYISNKTATKLTLKTIINNTNVDKKNASISLYNNSVLIGKSTIDISKNIKSETEFTFPIQENFKGILKIEDNNLLFDNEYYFTISKPKKINVLVIGKDTQFLEKIYTKNDFNLSTSLIQNLDYNIINEQHLIVLNELENITPELITKLESYVNEIGSIVIIPSSTNLEAYNNLARKLKLGNLVISNEQELKITKINYNHPLLKEVFEKRVTNFQYPNVKSVYKSNFVNSSTILSFENETPFVVQSHRKTGSVFWFNAALNNANSTFKKSPLIVPLFYNFAINSFNISNLQYVVGNENQIDVAVKMAKDEVLKIANTSKEFIPLQQHSYNNTTLKTSENPLESGFYQVKNNQEVLKTIAFNYNRNESDLEYLDISDLTNKNFKVSPTILEAFSNINDQTEINWLFKWFLAAAILFLFLEILILKFFKV